MSKFKGVKTNNAKIDAKINLRRDIDCSDKSVLEVFCGDGVMFSDVWKDAKHYEGIDIKKYDNDKRIVHIGDAATILKKIDLSTFDVFDIDAYGSPYECLFIILDKIGRAPIKKDIYFVITDGIQIDLRMGNIEKYFSLLSGIDLKKVNGIHKIHNIIINSVIKNISTFTGMEAVNKRIAVGNTGSGMRYFSFFLKKGLKT
jgi:predicted RNA-binding protein